MDEALCTVILSRIIFLSIHADTYAVGPLTSSGLTCYLTHKVITVTDFGLSRFGLLGRQARTINQSASQLSKRLHRRALPKSFPHAPSELSTPDSQPRASYFGSITLEDADAISESSGSESVPDKPKGGSRNSDSPAISLGSNSGKLLPHVPSPGKQSDSHRFVGTVDVSACLCRHAQAADS